MPRNRHQCPQCHTRFLTADILHEHINNAHTGAGPSDSPEPQGPTADTPLCYYCEKTFTYGGYSQHIRNGPCADLLRRRLRRDRERRQAESSPDGNVPQTQPEAVEAENSEPENADDIMSEGGEDPYNGDDETNRIEVDQQEQDMRDAEVNGNAYANEDEDDALGNGHTDAAGANQNIPASPPQVPLPPDPIADDGQVHLEKKVDEHGNVFFLEHYPVKSVGEPIRQATPEDLNQGDYPDVGDLAKPDFFEIVQVLMESGVSGNFRNKYLRLKRLRGMMPWKNNRELLKAVDKLPHGPNWSVQAITIKGAKGEETVEMWMRNSLQVLKQILGNKQLGQFIEYKAVRKWTSAERTERIRDELNTGEWMWEVQGKIAVDGTVISIIISSDETKLTNFSGDKKAHPVYMTIGNLPKRLRRRVSKRANILIGYLPVPKLDCEPNKTERAMHKRELFHRCLKEILAPLAEACHEGVEILCSDGGIRRIYPVLAAYIADFPEQCKITCIKNTHCPLCTIKPKKRGNLGDAPLRTRDQIIAAMDEHHLPGGSAGFIRLGLMDVDPFWKDYPHVDVGCLLTPDLLHQLNKGVMKDHLTKWVMGELGMPEIDERHRTMPEYHGMRHFKNGISKVSQWTGRELKEMTKVLLPVMSDCADRAVLAGRALLDFVYLAHSSSLTDSELADMDRALRIFHKNKAYFREQGFVATDKGFHGIPKIHMIQHYTHLIRQLGTPDGYNTETSERLHIDFAKMGYRASNKVNATKQMALYIQRMEAIAMHEAHLADNPPEESEGEADPLRGLLRTNDELDKEEEELDDWFDEEEADDPTELEDAGVRVEIATQLDEFLRNKRDRVGGSWETVESAVRPGDEKQPFQHPVPEIVIAEEPTSKSVRPASHLEPHLAEKFHHTLRAFLRKENHGVANVHLPNNPDNLWVDVWTRARLVYSPPPFKSSEGAHMEVIRAQPEKIDDFERVSRPPRFDTVMILMDEGGHGVHRYRVGRVRLIFRLARVMYHPCKEVLAYVEMFNRMSERPEEKTGLFTTTQTMVDGRRQYAVVRLSSIRMTCHLAPRYRTFEPVEPLQLHSDVLDLCKTFYFNIYATYFLYELVRHWSQERRKEEPGD